MPNQVYIGNRRPEELRDLPMPWCEQKIEELEMVSLEK